MIAAKRYPKKEVYEEITVKYEGKNWPECKWPVSEIAAPLCTNYYGDIRV